MPDSNDQKSYGHHHHKEHKVTWWIMGLIASSVMIVGSSFVGSFVTRLSNTEDEGARRGERLRTLEVKIDEQEKYNITRDVELKARLTRIELKVDDINQKIKP